MTARSASASSLPIYPGYCFSASATYNCWAKLTAADVHALRAIAAYEGQKVYFYSNHPINYVRLVGVIVGLDGYSHPQWGFMDFDDGSGATIVLKWPKPTPVRTLASDQGDGALQSNQGTRDEAITKGVGVKEVVAAFKNSAGECIDLSGIDLGSVVKVKGTIGLFRGVRQIGLERINLVDTTNAEAVAWEEQTAFRTSVLSKPWYLAAEYQHQLQLEYIAATKKAEDRKRRKQEKERREKEQEKRKLLEPRTDEVLSKERQRKRAKAAKEGEGASKTRIVIRESQRSKARDRDRQSPGSSRAGRNGLKKDSSAIVISKNRKTKKKRRQVQHAKESLS